MRPVVIASIRIARRRQGANRIVLIALVASLASVWGAARAAPASARSETKLVRYHGYSVLVPAAWPVYNLAADPATCVRFNRNAVYLGTPGREERCSAHSVGRTEAILIEPETGAGGEAHAASALPRLSEAQAQGGLLSSAQFDVDRERGLRLCAPHDAEVQRFARPTIGSIR